MLPYEKMILGLFKDGKFQPDVYQKLRKADKRVHRALVKALRTSRDPDIRETCAELLGERGLARAVPDLIEALDDESLFVRHDAMWAIESLCGFETAGLQFWLDTDFENPQELKGKVKAWWRLNRRFIENNVYLW